jgi:ketosteroid isomerase-like protein
MHENQKLLQDFYTAFARRDWRAMTSHYADDVHFTDRVFDLHGERAKGMWRMLCEGGTDLQVVLVEAHADEHEGSARWEADYTFSATGRRVKNRVSAHFRFADGKVVRHVDDFSFWKWAAQALGPVGVLLGWSGLVRRKVTRLGTARLDAFMAAR